MIIMTNQPQVVSKNVEYLGIQWSYGRTQREIVNYVLPFLINQSGSVLYYFTLKSANLTFAVPITNSIAFVVTAVTGWYLGEATPKPRTILGAILVVLGTACYIIDKS